MNFEDLVREIKTLSITQRRQLVLAIFDSMAETPASTSTHSTREIRAAVENLGKSDTPPDADDLRPAWTNRS